MDLTSPALNTLKIQSKKGYILFNPDSSEDAKIIILDDNSNVEITQNPENLVIYGPGDYEASGILIKGTRPEVATMYTIDTGDGRILHVVSDSVSKLTDEEDYDAVIVKAIAPIDEAQLSAISTKLVIVYGDSANIPENLKENKVNKINLKKKDELTSNVVYLEIK